MKVRAIATDEFRLPDNLDVDTGPAPMLQWIDIANLVVDPEYQRPIIGKGRRNVIKIATSFRWSCFAPVVVSPITGGNFAIVDGQHRTTAAALIGITAVPCQVIIATPAEQAKAFKEINGSVTQMTRQALHAAAVAAGDQEALEIEDVCSRAEVTVLRYPLAASEQEPGQTMAVGCLHDCIQTFGKDTVVTALQCITQTDNNRPGLLIATNIRALCALLAENVAWRDAGERLLAVFDDVDLERENESARMTPRPKGISIAMTLTARLRKHLEKRIPVAA